MGGFSGEQSLFEACTWPQTPVPAAAVAIHGLTDEVLAAALRCDAVHQALAFLLSGRRVVCYNAAFDATLLAQTAARHDLAPLDVRWECDMVAHAWFRGEWSRERRDFRWHRLPGAAHGAAADCRATLDLIRQMAQPAPRPWWRFR